MKHFLRQLVNLSFTPERFLFTSEILKHLPLQGQNPLHETFIEVWCMQLW